MSDVDAAIGARLIALRRQRGLSPQIIADQLNVSTHDYREMEVGRVRLSARQIFMLTELFGVAVSELVPTAIVEPLKGLPTNGLAGPGAPPHGGDH